MNRSRWLRSRRRVLRSRVLQGPLFKPGQHASIIHFEYNHPTATPLISSSHIIYHPILFQTVPGRQHSGIDFIMNLGSLNHHNLTPSIFQKISLQCRETASELALATGTCSPRLLACSFGGSIAPQKDHKNLRTTNNELELAGQHHYHAPSI